MTRTNSHRPSSTAATAAAVKSQPDKPKASLLSFFLSALFIALILSLCFFFAGAVVIVALLHLCLLGGALHRRCSSRHNHHYLLDCDDAPPKLSSAELRKLPRFMAKLEVARGSDDGLCVICLEDLIDGEWCRELPDCKHVFHANCVDTWLAKALACPFCRTTVSLLGEDKSA